MEPHSFLKNKYTQWYLSIITKAKILKRKKSKEEYLESHHIIPRCMGGKEKILLTAKEHYICHLLLCRMTTGSNKHKMINALIKMAFSKSEGQKRYTAKSYSLVRKLIAEKNSEMFGGVPKSEMARQNMKGRSGTWKRTDVHKRAISERQKGRGIGDENVAKRPDVREKIRQSKIGKTVVWSDEKKALQKERMKQWWSERKQTIGTRKKKSSAQGAP